MPSTWIYIHCPCLVDNDGEQAECDAEIEIECDVEPDDPNYGADADGNRGIYLKGGIETPTFDPKSCPNGCDLTEYEEEWKRRVEAAIKAKHDEHDDPPEPDYDDERYHIDPDGWNY